MVKKIIKKLAKKYLSEVEIRELLNYKVFLSDSDFDYNEARDLVSKIFNENPRFKDFILLRKSQLLHQALTGNKDYINGAITEWWFLESLYRSNENNEVVIEEKNSSIQKNIDDAIEQLKNLNKRS